MPGKSLSGAVGQAVRSEWAETFAIALSRGNNMHGLRHFSQVPVMDSDPDDSICGRTASDYLAHARTSRACTVYSLLLSWVLPRERLQHEA